MKTILSLFDFTGNWSKPWKDAGYEVVQVDIKNGIDILNWDYKNDVKGEVVGILAAVPCTDYAVSGARWFKDKDVDGRTDFSQKLVAKTKEIIDYYNPNWWVIENPISRIHNLNPWIGKPKMYFHPYEYAQLSDDKLEEQYSKKTALYGKFNNKNLEELKGNLPCLDTTRIHKPVVLKPNGKQYGYDSEEVKASRQITPQGFSRAFYLANEKPEPAYDIINGEKQFRLFK